MASSTTKHIYCILHGYDVAHSGDYPYIAANFDIRSARDGNTINWQVYENTWAGTDSGSGSYGYPFAAYISINENDPSWDDLYYIINKPVTSGSGWWDAVTLDRPSGSFTSTSDTATVYIWVQAGPDSCMSDGHFCYSGVNSYYYIDSFVADIPSAVQEYTMSYNSNGGSPTPSSQIRYSNTVSTLITATEPTSPLHVYYHLNSGTYDQSFSKVFNGWECDQDHLIYKRGTSREYYSINHNAIFTAQWSAGSFTTVTIPDTYYTLTYNYNGGTGTPASSSLVRSKNGYNSGGTHYDKGATYTTSSNLDLYPSYRAATVVYNNLPAPTKGGYRFDGWYKDSALTQKITADYTISANTTIYAKWTPLAVNQFQPNNTWGSIGAKVWRFNGTSWEPIAHVMKFENGQWTDLSQ